MGEGEVHPASDNTDCFIFSQDLRKIALFVRASFVKYLALFFLFLSMSAHAGITPSDQALGFCESQLQSGVKIRESLILDFLDQQQKLSDSERKLGSVTGLVKGMLKSIHGPAWVGLTLSGSAPRLFKAVNLEIYEKLETSTEIEDLKQSHFKEVWDLIEVLDAIFLMGQYLDRELSLSAEDEDPVRARLLEIQREWNQGAQSLISRASPSIRPALQLRLKISDTESEYRINRFRDLLSNIMLYVDAEKPSDLTHTFRAILREAEGVPSFQTEEATGLDRLRKLYEDFLKSDLALEQMFLWALNISDQLGDEPQVGMGVLAALHFIELRSAEGDVRENIERQKTFQQEFWETVDASLEGNGEGIGLEEFKRRVRQRADAMSKREAQLRGLVADGRHSDARDLLKDGMIDSTLFLDRIKRIAMTENDSSLLEQVGQFENRFDGDRLND